MNFLREENVKKVLGLCMAICVILCLSGAAQALGLYDGADRLAALQNDDGGWDWPLDDGDPGNASFSNTVGPIAMGLGKAYLVTSDSAHLTALQDASAFLLNKTNNFTPSDGHLAVELDSILGGTANVNHVKTNFYDQLFAGTYDRLGAGTLYSTAQYVQLIRDHRASQGNGNMAAWDIGLGLYSAAAIGASTSEWISGVEAEIDELDGSAYYDVIGLSGAILGLASAGVDYDPAGGEHVDASNLVDLADILSTYQLSTGGFTWNSEYVIEGDDNESVRETAYALLALWELDSVAYGGEALDAGTYMQGVQLATGGWEGYAGAGENNEVTGEALWGIATIPEPSTGLLVGLGLMGLAVRRRATRRS